MNTDRVRAAKVSGDPDVIAKYLPNNYSIVVTESYTDPKEFLIVGVDVAGWTLDDYVIPRLASGLHFAEEVLPDGMHAAWRAYLGALTAPCPEPTADFAAGYRAALVEAEARKTVLIEALKFYADPETYFAIGMVGDPPHGPFLDDLSDESDPGYPKPGKRARSALAGVVEAEPERSAERTKTKALKAGEPCPSCGMRHADPLDILEALDPEAEPDGSER